MISFPLRRLVFLSSLLLGNLCLAQDTPSFEDNLLTIPIANTSDAPGIFQDIVLRLEETGEIELVDFKTGVELYNSSITSVEIIQTESFPVQVFVKLQGQFNNGCPAVGQIVARRENNHFTIKAYLANNIWLLNPELILCTLSIVPYSSTTALDVYGLEAGTYTYSLNNDFTGEFTLAEANYFPKEELLPTSSL